MTENPLRSAFCCLPGRKSNTAPREKMRYALITLLLGLATWLATNGSAQAQTIFIQPNTNSPFQRPGVNPFNYVPQNTGGFGYPGYNAYNTPYGLQTQFVDPMQALQAQ